MLYHGRDLCGFYAKTPQKLALKIAYEMKGDKLRKYVLTDNFRPSSHGATRKEWKYRHVMLLRSALKARCGLDDYKLDRLWSDIREAINAKGRHLRRCWIANQTAKFSNIKPVHLLTKEPFRRLSL